MSISSGLQRGLEVPGEEVVRWHRAMPAGPVSSIEPPSAVRAKGRSAAGSACAREPPIVPRWRICGSPTCPADQASSGAWERTSSERGHVGVPGGGADHQVVAVDGDAGQLGQLADVDQDRGHGQPQLHHRQQRVAAGQQLGLVAVLGQQVQRVAGRRWPARTRTAPGSLSPPPPENPACPRRPARPGRCCDSRCSGRSCLPAPPAPRSRSDAGSRPAARWPPSPCPGCRTRTAGRAPGGTPPAPGAARRPGPGPRP